MATLYAQPYDLHATGFYFESLEEYEEKTEGHVNEFGQPVEEYEIQYISGDDEENAFAEAWEPEPSNLTQWFDGLDEYMGLGDMEQAAVAYLMEDIGMSFSDAMEKADEVSVMEGSVLDYAHEVIDDCYDLEKTMGNLAMYFDYERFARDMEISGDVATFEHGGVLYVITNANCF